MKQITRKNKPVAQPTLEEIMQRREQSFGIVIGAYTRMIGVWLTSTAPSISQAVSAFTIGFALYEGVQNYLGTPWYVALLVGLVASWAVESIGFTAVDERDQSQAHNQRTNDSTRHLPVEHASRYVNATFYVTLAVVFVCEVVPSAWGLWTGVSTIPDFLFRCSLLLWPVLSRLGAQLYAFRSVRLVADTTADDNELRTLQLELTKKEMIAESDLRVKTQRKNAAKHPVGDSVKHPELQGKMGGITLNSGYNGQGKIAQANDGKQRKIADRHEAIVALCSMYGAMSAPELSEKLMSDRGIKASAQTVGDDCRHLVELARLTTVGKKWDVAREISEALPVAVSFSTNGNSDH